MNCLHCEKPLTFISISKKEYQYHKSCFVYAKRLGYITICSCRKRAVTKCKDCGNDTKCCIKCEENWLDKYCYRCY